MATTAVQRRICNKNNTNGNAARASTKKNLGFLAESRQCVFGGKSAIFVSKNNANYNIPTDILIRFYEVQEQTVA